MKSFASDNNSGVHPNILKAIELANHEHAIGYGEDEITRQAVNAFKKLFNADVDVYFVFNGTGANVLALKTLSSSYNSIICAQTSHINVDECGAPENFTNCKLIPITTNGGKLTPALILPFLKGFGDQHHVQPGIISISQVTELGTVYKPEEIKAITTLAHKHGMYVHIDGARIANAIANLNVHINEITIDAGVDVISFGGTKNGMMFGEAIIFFNKNLSENFKYYRKQGMQLYSKMRYVSAQFLEYLKDDLWLLNAKHSNLMALKLYLKIKEIKQIKITQKVESNGIFLQLPENIVDPLLSKYFFYPWDIENSEYRWMCSFDTTENDIENFIFYIQELLHKENGEN
jgi:threonine aldolase